MLPLELKFYEMFISLQAFSFGHLLINFIECSFFGLFICLSWVQQSCVQTFDNNFDLNHTLESDCDDSLSSSWSSWREWSHCLFKIVIICPPLGPWNCTAVPLTSWEATSLPGTRCCRSLQIYPGLIIFPFNISARAWGLLAFPAHFRVCHALKNYSHSGI